MNYLPNIPAPSLKLSPSSHGYYSVVFSSLTTTSSIGAKETAIFLKKSGLDLQTLKQIWQIGKTSSTQEVNKEEFYRMLK